MSKIQEGLKAPDFTLPGSDGSTYTLSNFIGKNIVLFFYPKDNTPGWTKEALSFKDNLKTLDELNTIIFGINKDSINSHNKFIDKENLNYILLSDEDKIVCSLYDVLKEKNMYGKKTIGIERSTFIIDKQGNVSKIFRKVKVDGHVEEIVNHISLNLK
jgi:thioredoxin-dependent peroxiredoxin